MMETYLIKYCVRCKEIKPPASKFCKHCGAQLVVPPTDRLKLEVTARIMSGVNINGNGNADILRKVKKLSLAASNIDIQMKFCGQCAAEKPHDEDFCDEHGSELVVPKSDRERLAAIGWLLYQIEYHQDEDSRLLLNLRCLVTGHSERLILTAIAQPG